jgi:hypothetical protein
VVWRAKEAESRLARNVGKSSPTISAKPVGVGPASQLSIPTGERSHRVHINPFDSRFRLFPNELPYLLQCQRQIIFLQKKSSLDAFWIKSANAVIPAKSAMQAAE